MHRFSPTWWCLYDLAPDAHNTRPGPHTELGCVEGRAARLAFRMIAGIYPLMPQETPCVCSTLRRATRAVTAMYDAALAPSGLRITQFSVLVVLGRLGPLPVTRLAAEVALDRSTMGRNLDPLERRGLVRIKAGDVDQRERVAHLTAAGERAIETARPHWRAAQERIATLVSPFAIRSLADQLDALRPT
jgi:DNA-binding MarR family transcriptional regulator